MLYVSNIKCGCENFLLATKSGFVCPHCGNKYYDTRICGDIPTVIDGESLENPTYVPWTVHPARQKIRTPLEGQTDFFSQFATNPQGTSR